MALKSAIAVLMVLGLSLLVQTEALAAIGGTPIQRTTTAQPVKKPSSWRSRWYLSLSLFSLKEPLTLTRSDGVSSPIVASYLAFAPGITWRYLQWRNVDIGANFSPFFAFSEAGEPTSTENFSAPLVYRVKLSKVFGAQLAPLISWYVNPPHAQIGLSFPVTFRYGTWGVPTDPNPSLTYALSPKSQVAFGVFLDTRVSIKRYAFLFRMGFHQSFKNLSWIFGNEWML